MTFTDTIRYPTAALLAALMLAPPAQAAGAAEQQPAPTRARRVCERRALTGRRLEQTICYTPEQYAELVQAKRKELEEIQGRNNVQYDRTIVGINPGPL